MRPSPNPHRAPTPESDSSTPVQWKVWFWFAIILAMSFFSIQWVWGLILIAWGFSSLRQGEIYFIEPVRRTQSPLLFWTLVIVWSLSGIYMVIADFAPELLAS